MRSRDQDALNPPQNGQCAVNLKSLIVAAAVAVSLTACSSSNRSSPPHPAAHTAAAPAPSPSESSAIPDTGATDSSLMGCGTVVDTDPSSVGFKGSSLTAEQVISYLEALMLAGGIRDIPAGTLNNTETTILSGAAIDLENYHGDKLADDSEQFAQDEQSYNGADQVDTSYASAVTTDIDTLLKDCPASARNALKILHQG